MKKFPYNVEELTWDKDHLKNKENKYCYCGKGYTENKPMIQCSQCQQLFHSNCITCLSKPLLFGDIFGTFTCSVCNDSETFDRKNLSWIIIVHMVIYNLIKNAKIEDAQKPEKERREHYYFRWKEDVCAFIDDYWDYLLPDKKRSPTWNNTIASVLSTHSNTFLSGFEKFKQSAWWTLHKVEPPTGEKKSKQASRAKPKLKRPLKRSKNEGEEPRRKMRRINEKKQEDFMSSLSELSSDEQDFSDNEGTDQPKTTPPKSTPAEELSVVETVDEPAVVKTEATEPRVTEFRELPKVIPHEEPQAEDMNSPEIVPETPTAIENRKPPQAIEKTAHERRKDVTLLNQQDEWLLLQRLEHANKTLGSSAKRYKRKLAVRRLKRNLGIRLFDLDSQMAQSLKVAQLQPISTETYIAPTANQQEIQPQTMPVQIHFTPYISSFASRVMGAIRQCHTLTRDEAWLSSWNGRKLRPFIRRDFESKPSRMLLMAAIKACAGRPQPQLVAEAKEESIDYVYFQKEHLGQVNQLLSRSFWEGIDVSESLLFPEYSIVALYKRHVIGCAFMTPEAYVTYIAVDPGWGNAGIGQFMLYHLFQTAISKDVTLHVSANNNAMLLYQKFGFKPEEFIVNFYDKYLPANSAYSKNAFYLRLRR